MQYVAVADHDRCDTSPKKRPYGVVERQGAFTAALRSEHTRLVRPAAINSSLDILWVQWRHYSIFPTVLFSEPDN